VILDLPFFVSILRGLVGKTTLILVGDPDQLPSVGPQDFVFRISWRVASSPARP
jgi:ATP-dependent exoDNAse (exonuclease V) alpha subunit